VKKINDVLRYIVNIKTDKNILTEITFKTYPRDIIQDIETKYTGKKIENCPDEFMSGTYKYFFKKFKMQFEYKDVLDNKYSKNIVIDVFIIFNIVLGGLPFCKVSNVEFNDVHYEINGNLTTEKLIK
ncbi:MAG: hypothetical protein ACLTT7_06600, partial [Paraclostridium bifermentans]